MARFQWGFPRLNNEKALEQGLLNNKKELEPAASIKLSIILSEAETPIEIWPFRFLKGVHIFIFFQIANLAVQIFIFFKTQI